ncbi:MAG: flagellar hook-length control protein FliK [Desulfovibrio sp.]|jgi:flagellar hook-length control protein FliK|nr:flagellar hook-length control protein FliK [Desulfovibrio sp.]
MQILPIVGDIAEVKPVTPKLGQNPADDKGFFSALSSFIKEGREDYCGRPAEFAAYDQASAGPVNKTELNVLKKELANRKVAETSLDRLNQLSVSGRPISASSIFGALSGRSRASAPLSEEEGAALKDFLQKLGFDKEGQEETLALSDAGDVSTMWRRISAALDKLEDSPGFTRAELSALLKGLDLSDKTVAAVAPLLAKDEAPFDGASLKEALAPAAQDVAQRELAGAYAGRQMREALNAALAKAELNKRSAPVEDNRGSRASEQSEALMQKTVRDKVGVDAILDPSKNADGKPESGAGGKSEAGAGGKPEAGAGGTGHDGGVDAGNERRDFESDARDAAGKNGPFADKAFGKVPGKTPDQASGRTPGQTSDKQAGARADVSRFSEVIINAAVPGATPGQTTAFTGRAENSAPFYRGEIFAQVEQGILQGARQGAQMLTLQLDPAELGSMTLVLRYNDGELKASIRTERAQSAEVLTERLAELKASLEEAGIKVAELEVQTSLSDGDFSGTWEGGEEHNLMRDANERDRFLRLSRLWREEGEDTASAQKHQAVPLTAPDGGLHLVA